MKLFHAKSHQTDLFQPEPGQSISVVVAGISPETAVSLPTAYLCSTADMLVRYLELKGWQVHTYFQLANFQELSSAQKAISQNQLNETLTWLNIRPPLYLAQEPADAAQQVEADLLLTYSTQPISATHSSTVQLSIAPPIATEDAPPGEADQPSVMIEELVDQYSADVLRVYFAQNHYRQSWHHDQVKLLKASQCVEKLNAALTAVNQGQQTINITPAFNRFVAAMDNDLDTRKGIATLLNLADEILFRSTNGYAINEAQAVLKQLATIFGLQLDEASMHMIDT